MIQKHKPKSSSSINGFMMEVTTDKAEKFHNPKLAKQKQYLSDLHDSASLFQFYFYTSRKPGADGAIYGKLGEFYSWHSVSLAPRRL